MATKFSSPKLYRLWKALFSSWGVLLLVAEINNTVVDLLAGKYGSCYMDTNRLSHALRTKAAENTVSTVELCSEIRLRECILVRLSAG